MVIVSYAPRVVCASKSSPRLSKSRTSSRRANVTGSKEGKVVESNAGSSRSWRVRAGRVGTPIVTLGADLSNKSSSADLVPFGIMSGGRASNIILIRVGWAAGSVMRFSIRMTNLESSIHCW